MTDHHTDTFRFPTTSSSSYWHHVRFHLSSTFNLGVYFSRLVFAILTFSFRDNWVRGCIWLAVLWLPPLIRHTWAPTLHSKGRRGDISSYAAWFMEPLICGVAYPRVYNFLRFGNGFDEFFREVFYPVLALIGPFALAKITLFFYGEKNNNVAKMEEDHLEKTILEPEDVARDYLPPFEMAAIFANRSV